MSNIRVFLANEQPITRRGMSLLLSEQPDIEVVEAAVQGANIIETLQRVRPNVVLVDIDVAGPRAFDVIHLMTESCSGLAVLVLTVNEQEEFLFQALQAGAIGYLLKSASVEDLMLAIRTINSGDVFICPIMATKLVGDYLKRADTSYSEDDYEGLSRREREVLPLLAESRTNEEIASLFRLSPYTVQTYRQRIMKKLDLHSKTELLKYALRKGLISLDQ